MVIVRGPNASAKLSGKGRKSQKKSKFAQKMPENTFFATLRALLTVFRSVSCFPCCVKVFFITRVIVCA